jgi:hypothetical protein
MQHGDEAIKLLQDWSKWVVTINTAAIGALGYTILSSPDRKALYQSLTWLQQLYVMSAICGFGLSLLSASYLLLALPGVMQRYEVADKDDVFLFGTWGGEGLTVNFFTNGEHFCFLFGVLSFAAYACSFVNFWFASLPYVVACLLIIFLMLWLLRDESLFYKGGWPWPWRKH